MNVFSSEEGDHKLTVTVVINILKFNSESNPLSKV